MISYSRIYSDMIDDLVRDLTGRSDVRRASAVERCGGLPEDLLLEITSRVLVHYHKQVIWRSTAFLLGVVGVVSLAYLLQGNTLFAYGIAGLVIAHHLHLTYRHTGRSLQRLLQNSEDKRLIPILLLKYSTVNGSCVLPQLTYVRDLGLTQLLPYVTQSDDEMWTHQMRSRLAALLRYPNTADILTHGVLHSLGQIGDESAIADLLPFTQQKSDLTRGPRTRRFRLSTPEVRDAAIKCLNDIQSRENRRHQHAVLLRASATDVPLSVSLPRAIDSDAYRADLELTRPASSNNRKPTQGLEEQCQG